MDCECQQQQSASNWFNDNLLLCLIAAAVVLGIFYLIIKAGVKNGILEVLAMPDCPLVDNGRCC